MRDTPIIWASNAAEQDIYAPSADKQKLGWVQEAPPHQWFNWYMNRTDKRLNEIETPLTSQSYTWFAADRTEHIEAHARFELPASYVVGAEQLRVYLDGVLCHAGAEQQYVECGTPGTESNYIRWNDDVDRYYDIRIEIPLRINEPYQTADEALAAQVDDLKNRVDALEQPKLGTQYVSAANTREKTIQAGELFVLPVEYVVGGGQLHVFVDGVLCFPGENFAYVEVGNPGSYSTEIKFNQDMPPERDIRIHIFVMASEKYIKLDESLSLDVVKHLLDRYAISYQRKDIVVAERIEAYLGYTVPEFVVGANNLTVFLNGKLLRPNEDYVESGDTGKRSTIITFTASVEVNSELTFITPTVILN